MVWRRKGEVGLDGRRRKELGRRSELAREERSFWLLLLLRRPSRLLDVPDGL